MGRLEANCAFFVVYVCMQDSTSQKSPLLQFSTYDQKGCQLKMLQSGLGQK